MKDILLPLSLSNTADEPEVTNTMLTVLSDSQDALQCRKIN